MQRDGLALWTALLESPGRWKGKGVQWGEPEGARLRNAATTGPFARQVLPSAGAEGLGWQQPCWNILTKFLMVIGEGAQRGHLIQTLILRVSKLEVQGMGEGDMTGSRSHSKLVAVRVGIQF